MPAYIVSFILALMLIGVPSVNLLRTKRQIFDPDFGSQGPYQFNRPQGPYQNFGPPQGRPPFGGPFNQQGPPQDDFQDFDPERPPGAQFLRPRPQRPNGNNNPYTFPGVPDPLNGLSKAFESIARYDDKRCVARMLCEVAAGGSPGSGYRGDSGFFDFSGLRGIADLLGAMTDSEGASPMFMFGRAALLGATMRDPYRCYSSYPECPRDPNRLVDYLNNHNGGFFKLFNRQDDDATAAQDTTTRRPPYYRRGKKVRKQKYPQGVYNDEDIRPQSQSTPSKDVPISDRTGTGELRLDTEQLKGSSTSHPQSSRGGKSLFFPSQPKQETSRDSTAFSFPSP